jgi:putative tryptophan/tyrosine transport system substrate-binding protein
MRRIGVLSGFPEGDAVGESLLAAFRQKLTSLGWIEGNNIGLEVRWAEADNERMRAHAVELTRMMPDAIVVHGSKALTAVRRETDRIPIVFASIADPIAAGYVASLARPGGNVTGFSIYAGMPSPKLLQLLKDVAPGLTRVALLITPDNPGRARLFQGLGSVARSLGVENEPMFIGDPASVTPTIAAFAQEPNRGLVVTSDVFMIAHRRAIADAAARHHLPAIYQDRSFVVDGGLMSYSVDRREQYRRVATYVDRILKGAKPADLPVQEPIRFEFVLNLNTARALGIQTRMLLARADEVIE